MKRTNISTGARWEPIIGYSRAVRVGDFVRVSGTTAIDATGKIVGPGNPYQQTCQALRNIGDALVRAGASLADVVSTRMYLTDISQWEQIGRAHGEVFGEIRPTTVMVEVSRLISPEMLVEIEAEAIIVSGTSAAQGTSADPGTAAAPGMAGGAASGARGKAGAAKSAATARPNVRQSPDSKKANNKKRGK